MFYFPNTRKPDFRTTKRLDYDEYWRTRGFAVLTKLKEREVIMLEQIPKGSSVLIVGCGNSRLPLDLRDKGCGVEVGDLSEAILVGLLKEGIKGVKLDLNNPKDLESYDNLRSVKQYHSKIIRKYLGFSTFEDKAEIVNAWIYEHASKTDNHIDLYLVT